MSHFTPAPRHHLTDYEHAIDRVVTAAAFIGPLTSLPQIIEIWFVDESAAGVSVLTWSAFVLMAVVWLLYGLVHKQRPVIISNTLWIIAQSLIVLGALRFDFDWL
jgi:uncharacterized protein with PQ loop repeat